MHIFVEFPVEKCVTLVLFYFMSLIIMIRRHHSKKGRSTTTNQLPCSFRVYIP